MSTLVAVLGVGKGTWSEVFALIETKKFEKTILLIDSWAAQTYRSEHEAVTISLPEYDLSQAALRDVIIASLAPQLHGEFEVAVNIASGKGVEHQALLAALVRLGVGFRMVTIDNNEVVEL
jgi:hypothetical protein